MPNTSSSAAAGRARGYFVKQGLAWAALLIALLCTVAYWRYSVLDEERRVQETFVRSAERELDALVDRMRDHEQVLLAGRALFVASREVERGEWRAYVAGLDLETSLPGFLGIGFALAIPASAKAAHERSIRAEGFPDYAIRPGGQRPFYTSIVYLEPFSGRNLRAFGFDMFSEPTRRIAMERARDTGLAAVTHKVTLVQETEREPQAGFLMYLPVYDTHAAVRSVEDRRRALVGWVYSPFRAADLMSAVFSQFDGDAEVQVFDGEPSPAHLLYASAGAARPAVHRAEFKVDVAGVEWTARFRSSESFESRIDRSASKLILLSGVLLSLLIFSMLYADTRQRVRLQAQVRERTLELEHARDEAESASRAKTAFLATVSHELRTPLNAVIGFSSILLQDRVTEEQRKQLTIINRSGLHLLELIKEILDIASIEAGHLVTQIEPVDLRRVLEEQCELLQGPARDGGLYLRLAACDPALVVAADVGRLSQVVRNLLSNAIKFTDRGGVTVRCETRGDRVFVTVEDTGIGIPPEQQAMLFVPFQRGDPKRANRPGTGLGLAISRRLVEAMNGEIGFESVAGEGSRFWFTLPLAPRADVRVPHA